MQSALICLLLSGALRGGVPESAEAVKNPLVGIARLHYQIFCSRTQLAWVLPNNCSRGSK